jgi:hypothetical protein
MNLILPPEYSSPEPSPQPLDFPWSADKNAVVDARGIPVAVISPSIPADVAHKIAKLFAAAPDMTNLLIVCASLLTDLAKQNNLPHGTDAETEEESRQCPLCQIAEVIGKLQ